MRISGYLLDAIDEDSLVYQDLLAAAPKLALKDISLWGTEAEGEASIRLNWIDAPITSLDLLPQLEELKMWAAERGLTEIVLCGMGGSTLAPEVIAKTYGKKLTVLDSTDPTQISLSTPQDLQRTLFVVASKSGGTIETRSHAAYFQGLLKGSGFNPSEHMVVITDPGSTLDVSARKEGLRTINADPNVGGRYSALTAFGLVPATLVGVDCQALLKSAESVKLHQAVVVATLLAENFDQEIAFCDTESNVPGLADWIEQLVAESTGKNSKGRLPVVIEEKNSAIAGEVQRIGFTSGYDLSVVGDLGEHFIFWELVTALLSRAIGINPFDQPNVTEAKERTAQILTQGASQQREILLETDHLLVRGAVAPGVVQKTLKEILSAFAGNDSHYIATMAYLNRFSDMEITGIRENLALLSKKPTTFGWGPRFLHSTGQFHKGGQPNGSFFQITGESENDLPIPGEKFTFQQLLIAQAQGDGQALMSRGFPFITIHLKNRKEGIRELLLATQAG